MDYNKIFNEVAKECKDIRAYIILGLLQSIRDKCPPDNTTREDMLNLAYNPKDKCIVNYTQLSTKIDTPKHRKLEYE